MRGLRFVFIIISHKIYLVLLFLSTLFSLTFLIVTHDTFANYENDYDSCISESGGHNNIESVKWACSIKNDNGWNAGNVCSLWIADSNSRSTTITLDNSASTTIRYWGMCTDSSASTGLIRVEKDNDSINDAKDLQRGNWGSPNSINTTINTSKFIEDITPTISADKQYNEYTRTITVGRCYEGQDTWTTEADACSEMNQTITLRIKREPPTYKLYINQGTGTHITVKKGISTLSNNSTIYRGDVLLSTFTLDEGYSWGTHTINNITRSNGYPHVVDSDVTVTTTAIRNRFSGQASATGNELSIDTGWISDSTSATTTTENGQMNCINDGCTADFYVSLRRDAGNGKTSFSTDTALQPGIISPIMPSTTNTLIGTTLSKKLYPGQNTCRQITFQPFGNLSNDANRTAKVCMNANVTYFQGKSNILNSANSIIGTTNWHETNQANPTNIYLDNCTNGCAVKFSHQMQRIDKGTGKGIGSSSWQISRESNLITSTKAISSKNNLANGTFNTDSSTVITDNNDNQNYILYPGMVVCEKLTFKPNNRDIITPFGIPDTNDVSTYICASALGNAQPPDDPDPDRPENPTENGDTSLINIKVRNTNVNKYIKYQRNVYAKPGDGIAYRATYYPLLQYTFFLKPQEYRLNGSTILSNPSKLQLGTLFNVQNSCNTNTHNIVRCWNNAFGLSSNFSNDTSYNYANRYAIGNFNRQTDSLATYEVSDNDTGKELQEIITTNTATKVTKTNQPLISSNTNGDDRTTPRQVSFSKHSDQNLGNVITNNPQPIRTATAKIPYNFDTTINLDNSDNNIIYAGESQSVSFTITIDPKFNHETMNNNDANYVTKVGNAKYKIIIYRGDQKDGSDWSGDNLCSYYGLGENQTDCGYSEEVNGATAKNIINNRITNRYDSATIPLNRNFYAQDLAAGSHVCVSAAFYPANSGVDTNLDPNGNNQWRISNSKCFTIAKKPSLQVWGDNLYSNGAINTATSIKRNLSGVTNYNVNTEQGPFVFGSWAELGIISSGIITGLSSGASLSGGGDKINLQDRSPLTFANQRIIGALGNSIATTNAATNKTAIIDKYIYGGENTLSSSIADLEDESGNKQKGNETYYYYNQDTDLTLLSHTMTAGKTKIVHSTKNILIDGNIISDGSYSTIDQVPRLIIYAQNITINCHVTRIDAILIANNTIITCNNFENDYKNLNSKVKAHINDSINSTPLTINGAIIAGNIIANRTYGSATGVNSSVPAEIINFDPALYQWGGNDSNTETTDGGSSSSPSMTTHTSTNMDSVYSKELPPRY